MMVVKGSAPARPLPNKLRACVCILVYMSSVYSCIMTFAIRAKRFIPGILLDRKFQSLYRVIGIHDAQVSYARYSRKVLKVIVNRGQARCLVRRLLTLSVINAKLIPLCYTSCSIWRGHGTICYRQQRIFGSYWLANVLCVVYNIYRESG